MKIFNWFFDLLDTNKAHTIKRSLTGEPLVEINEGVHGVGISTTFSGKMRANVLFNCIHVHDYDSIVKVINGYYDNCLTKEDKQNILKLLTRTNPVNYSWITKRNSKGNLYFDKLY